MAAGTLIITLGDAAGLGPELAARVMAEAGFLQAWRRWRLILAGPRPPMVRHLARQGLSPFWRNIDPDADPRHLSPGVYFMEPVRCAGLDVPMGFPCTEGGTAAGESLDLACDWVLDGRAQGMVTMPLHKAMLRQAGYLFPGHTEFLAHRAGMREDEVTMHLCGPRLRVSLVTTHPPYAQAPALLTQERIEKTIVHTAAFLERLDLPRRRVAVCGLNPHAGESGAIGHEEAAVIAPAVDAARSRGVDVHGPLPGDTVFHRAWHGEFDAVVAMFHDQGLAPLKLVHFNDAVNVTLGLPFVRTSVDHGVGFDITGRDVASPNSFLAALHLAARLVSPKEKACSAA